MSAARRWAVALGAGLLATAGVASLRHAPLVLEPGSRAWRVLVRGATPSGALGDRAVLLLPGVDRREATELFVRIDPRESERPTLGLAVDQGPVSWSQADREGRILWSVPEAPAPGVRLDFFRAEDAPRPVLQRIEVREKRGKSALAFVFVAAAATAFCIARTTGAALGAGLGLTVSALFTLAFAPLARFVVVDARLLVPVLLFAGGVAVAWRQPQDRKNYWTASALVAAAVFGVWVRCVFLPSAGAWDTEYWKAWTARAASSGIARVYGDEDAVPEGRFVAQLRGKEDRWAATYHGKTYNVDYPPLAMALWRGSWAVVRSAVPSLETGEAENVAVKLPAVCGDLAAAALLFFALGRTRRGLAVAALYWALPVSWLSSAVLGFLDGAYVPFAALALVTASAGRAGTAGALLAVAALIKPQAVLVIPAAAAATFASRASVLRAAVSGLLVTALALLPFFIAGTLAEAVVHMTNVVFQERLSGGFPNPWWVLGHVVSVAEGHASFSSAVDYAPLSGVPFPARNVGAALFLLAAVFVFVRARAVPGFRAAALAGAVLMLSYGILGIGVHENHPHLLFFLLALTGLPTKRLAVIGSLLSSLYVVNLLFLSGIGRFYGLRYPDLEPVTRALASLRLAPGVDVTLVLALANTAIFASMLFRLREDLARLREPA